MITPIIASKAAIQALRASAILSPPLNFARHNCEKYNKNNVKKQQKG